MHSGNLGPHSLPPSWGAEGAQQTRLLSHPLPLWGCVQNWEVGHSWGKGKHAFQRGSAAKVANDPRMCSMPAPGRPLAQPCSE